MRDIVQSTALDISTSIVRVMTRDKHIPCNIAEHRLLGVFGIGARPDMKRACMVNQLYLSFSLEMPGSVPLEYLSGFEFSVH